MKRLAQTTIPGREIQTDARFDKINRWTFLMMQVFEARSFLSLAESTHQVHQKSSMDEVLTQQALFRGFILSYAKCFASTGKGRMKLDQSKVYEKKAVLLPTHERIMELRHKFAAHSDASGLDEAIITIQELDDHFQISHLYSIANPLNEYSDYTKVLDELDNYIVLGIDKALDSLEKQLGKKIVVQRG
jgi:hypothetical protein